MEYNSSHRLLSYGLQFSPVQCQSTHIRLGSGEIEVVVYGQSQFYLARSFWEIFVVYAFNFNQWWNLSQWMDGWMDGQCSRWHATGHPSSGCLDCGRGMLTIDLFYSNSSRIETQAKNKKSREVIYLQLNEVFCEERDIAFRLLLFLST